MISQVRRIGLFRRLDMILELADEEEKRGENKKKRTFSETQQVTTARCSLQFFWGRSKFQVYIGSHQSWANTGLREKLQDIGVTLFKFHE